MAPLRPLTDLDLIAVFKQLTPNSQLVAGAMSPRSALLVRDANRRLKMLVITDCADLRQTRRKVDAFSLGAKPCMRLIEASDSSSSSSDFPLSTRNITKWNCLLMGRNHRLQQFAFSAPTIAALFPAVTELKFIKWSSPSHQCQLLVDLLLLQQQDQDQDHQGSSGWARQLTSLLVSNFDSDSAELARRLVGAINDRLPALRHLALHWGSDAELPELEVISRLQVLSICLWPRHTATFLRFLERYGVKNADHENFSVHLLPFGGNTDGSYIMALFGLGDPVHSRPVVRYSWDPLNYAADRVSLLCERFRSLTSLAVCRVAEAQVGPLFTDISSLAKLAHLQLEVNFERGEEGQRAAEDEGEEAELPEPPTSRSPSTRALELKLVITSHEQVQWLNLAWTLPALQAIHLMDFQCRQCRVSLRDFLLGRYHREASLSTTARKCLQETLTSLHSAVPRRRIILGSAEARSGTFRSLEELQLSPKQ